ncbi:IS1 family transposase, partial [Escherichia coli]
MSSQIKYSPGNPGRFRLFYAYDRIRRTVVAHVFGERTLATLERLLSLLSAFEVVVW